MFDVIIIDAFEGKLGKYMREKGMETLRVSLYPCPWTQTSSNNHRFLQRTVECVDRTNPYQQQRKYGCFCGFGGNGNQPVDDFDRCCQVNDECFGAARSTGCPRYYMWYSPNCENGIPKCVDFSVIPLKTECRKKACNCNIAAALCLRENSDKYNPKFVDYDQNLCKTVK
ncbi:basic phospholipase A2 taipoxin alpha chain-like [Scyliorhinus canicula]|uniref:basic phospholipase A2 taipoxin alpha chain-like n=1 Tax=Scyliorhinus canicula TaxID=7830 RepID=UPI0018F3C697|nr:basic phospholipase A2 taipoxin alpha chain-like [Scyliorhinus canicula]